MINVRNFLAIAFVISCFTFSSSNPAAADLIYNFVTHELFAESESGEMVTITGGELVMVDGADDDGILQTSELISATVHTTDLSNLTANVLEGSLFGNGTFSNGQLIGGILSLDEDDLDDTYVDWGGGDKITYGDDGVYFVKDISPGNFVIATRAVPEPSSAMIVFGALVIGLCGRRKKKDRR